MVLGRTLLNVATGATLIVGDLDPSAGSGITAPRGSLFVREGSTSNSVWLKTGAAATAWTRLASTADLPLTITPQSLVISTPSPIIDLSLGSRWILTLQTSPNVAIQNPTAGEKYHFEIRQDATGSRTMLWPSGAGPNPVRWPAGLPPVLSVGANAIDYVTLLYTGSYFLGHLEGGTYA